MDIRNAIKSTGIYYNDLAEKWWWCRLVAVDIVRRGQSFRYIGQSRHTDYEGRLADCQSHSDQQRN